MRESEIRRRVKAFLEQTARQVVLPATLGVGLSLGAGCSDESVPLYGAPVVEAGADAQSDMGPVAKYAAPMPDAATDVGPVAKYAAPMPDAATDVGPVAKYAAPMPDAATDVGPVAKYAAPMPDAST